MRKKITLIFLLLPMLILSQISLNQVDDFEDFTTKNWTKGGQSNIPNQNILTGGPDGADDNFLRIESIGGGGSDSNLVTFNNAQWQGNYVSEGITFISMDVRNSGANLIQLRLAFRNNNFGEEWSSTNPIAVQPGQGWQTIVFPISENDLTKLNNFGGFYTNTFTNVTDVRILHNDAPDWSGDSIVATLDVDNIQALDNDLGLADPGEPKISLNLIDDFEGFTTENWTKGGQSNIPNQNILTGGPDGADDNFLRIESTGGGGSDSKLVTFNNAQWQGDYISEGVTYIAMDVRNSGANLIQLRLAFRNNNFGEEWSSTNPIAVQPGQGWQTIVFPISENDLTKLNNFGGFYSNTFNNVTDIRILHNDAPSWSGDEIAATLDVDNIQALDNDLGLADPGEPKISLNLIDDFEGFTTENWTKGGQSNIPNQNILTGGPDGADDNFLRIESTGGGGSDSKLVTFNNAQWQGDYISEGVTYISMDARNSGSSIILLRLAFRNNNFGEEWSSTNPIAIVPGQGWQSIVFPISENDLTKLNNFGGFYSNTFSNITDIRILHNDAPDWNGDSIVATLDLDNIQASDNLSIVSRNDIDNTIKIYPNPTQDILNIRSSGTISMINIYDLNGKLVRYIQLDNQNLEESVNIGDLLNGIYHLQVITKNNVQTLKFVKI